MAMPKLIKTLFKLKRKNINIVKLPEPLERGDSMVILYKLEYTAHEAKILNFYMLR
ncbi:hypothetical protein [Methanobrevibacter sp. UBA212]|jgi:hypothetical protein|uniref:hypothetical protein n=1 Tax=Methanobrevibacter sp. UBA212 TaxID=1915476 RepID=UPI0025F63264|nr:hypothetical protein [Methanobrevibacter sp. UBA212]